MYIEETGLNSFKSITLLVAIAEAAQSPDVTVSSQIPSSLRVSRTLVLCPPTLIANWVDELLFWAPEGVLGEYRPVDSSVKSIEVRLDIISNWHEDGGVLIMGYDMFRMLVLNKGTAKRGPSLLEEEHKQVLKHLLEGPNIIVADEAHKMKNRDASITHAASRFRSRSRIALTGSPLANNVEEYHTMIEWVAPNYLGPIVEFRAKYVEPIQQGLYVDSSAYERRRSLKMLGVLKEDLSPKVHRADVSVLRNDLKAKKEFVIIVPLTDLQIKAYTIYVHSMLERTGELTKGGQLKQTTLWHWLAILSLLCNHPSCFKEKLTERKDDAKTKLGRDRGKDSTSDDDPIRGAASVWKVGVSEDCVRREMELFKQVGSAMDAITTSNKVRLLLQILDASKAIGDKVLIFSQSIPTLNYLEDLCIRTNRKYARLDGQTRMDKRQAHAKEFNVGKTELYLISTTAGGLGLNLPGANRVIIFDFKFNPINEEQAVGRAYRIGQKKPVFVYRFVAGGTFEEVIHNKAVFKMQLASRVIDKKNPVAWAKKNAGDFLFEPRSVTQEDLSEFKGKDPDVLDKLLDRQQREKSIRAIVMTDTFEQHDNDVLTAEEQREVRQLLSDEQLKRSNPQAWQALVHKRIQQEAARQSQVASAAKAQMTPAQRAIIDGQQVRSQHLLKEALPAGSNNLAVGGSIQNPPNEGAPSAMSISSNSGRAQPKMTSNMPELSPIAGANTRIDASTPPRHYSPHTAGVDTTPRPNSMVQLTSSTLQSPLTRPRQLSSTASTPEEAVVQLQTALKRAVRGRLADSSEKSVETVAREVQLAVKTSDPARVIQRIIEVARHLIQEPELVVKLLSGELSAKDVADMKFDSPLSPGNTAPIGKSLIENATPQMGSVSANGSGPANRHPQANSASSVPKDTAKPSSSKVGDLTTSPLNSSDQSSDGRNSSPFDWIKNIIGFSPSKH